MTEQRPINVGDRGTLFGAWCVIAIIIAGLSWSNWHFVAAIKDLQERVEALEAPADLESRGWYRVLKGTATIDRNHDSGGESRVTGSEDGP